MSFLNILQTSIMSLRAHKLRAILTMVGIVIGISSVVTILSIGNGLKSNINKGANNKNINKVNIIFEPENYNIDIKLLEPFNDIDIVFLEGFEEVDSVRYSSDIVSSIELISSEGEYFGKKATLSLKPYRNNLNLLYGESQKALNSNEVIILSEASSKKIFGDNLKNSIGKAVSISGVNYEVIGIIDENDDFADEYSYISSKEFNRLNEAVIDSTGIDIFLKPNADKEAIVKEIINGLKYRHEDLNGEYMEQDPNELTKFLQDIIGGITIFITFVTGISLFVGGIGIMNMMYVSVSERNKEIGIRRAIGAKPKDIFLQFLLESIIITGIGGLTGIFFGFLFGKAVGLFLPFKPVLSINSFLGATFTSICVGIIFGIIPSINASKLDPIKCIYK